MSNYGKSAYNLGVILSDNVLQYMQVVSILDKKFVRDRITQLRMKKGVSEYKMSYDLGHSRSYIHNISSGKSLPPVGELLQICEYFAITPSQFFDESIENPALLQTAIDELHKLNDDDLLLLINNIHRMIG